MKLRSVGKSGINASVIGLGTWAMGGAFWGGTDEQASIKTLQMAIDHGINLIDTAPVYGFGLAEEIVGKATAQRRDQVVISTKCGLDWQSTRGTFVVSESGYEVYRYLGKDFIQQEIENSLRRLQTDYIDIYYTHWQDETTPLAETMEVLQKLKQQGKIRAIGASNVNLEQLRHYQELGGIDVGQEEYSLLHRDIENDLLPFCLKQQISMFAYCPLCQGLLTGKIKPGHNFKPGDMRSALNSFAQENLAKALDLNTKLQQIADRYNATLAQLIIAWTIMQPGITHALCGVRNQQQLEENLTGASIDLEPNDIAKIDQLAKSSGVSFGMYE